MKTYLVTGGTGFIGRALVRALVQRGDVVRSLDDDSRGSKALLRGVDVELITGDVRDINVVMQATKNVDCVVHLAYVNGTQTFYEQPRRILDIALKGMINVLEGCIKNNVPEFSLASSPEAYQATSIVPTDETVCLSVPDPLNPRYSYGGGKLINELMLLNCSTEFRKATIFRPHSIYGPQMGHAHVIPQLTERIQALFEDHKLNHQETIDLQIQGNGTETRSFCYIDDCVQGILTVLDKGAHRNIYHIGTEEEVTIKELAEGIGSVFYRMINVIPGPLQPGSTLRRCPNISKLRALGYNPTFSLKQGLRKTINVEVPA